MNYSRKTWYHDVLMRVINFILRHCTAYVGKKQVTVVQFTQIYTATLPNKKQNTYTWIFIHLNEQKLKLIMLNLILVPLDVNEDGSGKGFWVEGKGWAEVFVKIGIASDYDALGMFRRVK